MIDLLIELLIAAFLVVSGTALTIFVAVIVLRLMDVAV